MSERPIRLVIPTGRMHGAVLDLLDQAGVAIPRSEKNYRPRASDPAFEVKLMKAANVPTLIELGAHDIGFTGLDWIEETGAEVESLLDTGLLPVRVVVAGPAGADPFETVQGRPLVVASEYERLTRRFMDARGRDWRFIRTYGATEVFPPEDADLIVDNTATGSALAANRLEIIERLLSSTTHFVANRRVLEDPALRRRIEDLTLLMGSVIAARQRVLLEMNVSQDKLASVVDLLPAMKAPTVQPLYGNGEYAIKAAVARDRVPRLIPELRRAGARDILETEILRVIP